MVADMAKSKVFSSGSLVWNCKVPEKLPGLLLSANISITVLSLAARVAGRAPTRLKPLGKLRLLRFRSASPMFLTVKVLLRVPPTIVLPKS